MTTVTLYRSTDASAPALNGNAGSLVTVLDAVLVNGYGSQSAAGWTKAYSATNKAAYRNSPTDGTGFYVNVHDAAPGGGGGREARMTGFETMSAVDTGTGQFPTSAQVNIGIGALVLRKSTTADGTARVWTCVADDTCFYFFAETGDQTNPTVPYCFFFGDIFSYKASDAYRCLILGRDAENTNSWVNEGFTQIRGNEGDNNLASVVPDGNFMVRHWTGVGGSIAVGKCVDSKGNQQFCLGGVNSASNFPYPNGPDGGLYLSPVWVYHSNALRGYMKGLWAPCHLRPLNHGDTFSGTGNLNGKSFIAQNVLANSNNYGQGNNNRAGQAMLEYSSTWS